uniref:Helix-turn-helix domain-containing protein n=1 Tax=Streptomyces sp. NBC_00049 TaxID=2903617 RepID=A0AAU2JKV7_9ACTN
MNAAPAVTIPAQRITPAQREGVVRALVTRFPASWLTRFTGDTIRVATLADDYGRPARGETARRGCFAADKTLADQLNLHPVTVQSAFAELEDRKNDGAGAVVYSTGSRRATKTRWVKPIGEDEKCATVSSHALTALSANRFTVYAYIRTQNDFEAEPSAKEITRSLEITRETVRQALLALLAEGWVSKTQEGGGRGRETRYQAHDVPVFRMTQLPLFPQPRRVKVEPQEPEDETLDPTTDPGQVALFDLSACSRNPLDSTVGNPLGPAVGNPLDSAAQNMPSFDQALSEQAREVSCGSARRALPVVAREAPLDNPPVVEAAPVVAAPAAASPEPQESTPRTRTSTISTTAWRVMRRLPLKLSSGQYGLAAKAIERAVAEVGGDVERITNRVHRNLAGEDVRAPYGWLITRGLRNDPCPAPDCERGFVWGSGEPCRICEERFADRRGTPLIFRDRATAIYEVTWTCTQCERPGPGEVPADGVCDRCCPGAVAPSHYFPADVQGRTVAVRAGFRHKAAPEAEHAAQAVAREQKRARRRALDEQRRAGILR